MERMKNAQQESLSALLSTYECEIKSVISEKYSIPSEDLTILPQEEGGVYMSEEEPETFCCLVVENTNGFLYLLSAKITDGQQLTNFKSDVIS